MSLKRSFAALALSLLIAPAATAAPRRPQPDPADRTPGPVRYLVAATVLQLTECQPGEQVPCYVPVLVDLVRDTESEARDLARQMALGGWGRGSARSSSEPLRTSGVSRV